MSDVEENLLSLDEENLTFTREQIDYLKDEFERQRRWVNLLSTRETHALEELERTQNSISYRFGRAVTWFPRTIIKILKPKKEFLDKLQADWYAKYPPNDADTDFEAAERERLQLTETYLKEIEEVYGSQDGSGAIVGLI